jgi:putative ABC transport system permease protein
MIKNYLVIAWRNTWKNPTFSFIKIFGLAMGISLFLVLLSIIKDQLSFDRFHPNTDAVYRVNTEAIRKNGGTESYATSPFPLGAYLNDNYPDIEKMVRLNRSLRGRAKYGDKELGIQGFFTDPEFFEVFGFELLAGNSAEALKDPNSIILSQETAEKFFNNSNPVGKILVFEGLGNFTVTGVIKKPQGKTHIQFDALGANSYLRNIEATNVNDWLNYYSTYLYLHLKQGTKVESLANTFNPKVKEKYANLVLESRDKGYKFYFQPLSKIVPGPLLSNNLGRALPTEFLWVMGIFAGIVLISAAFNYNSLSLAKSLSRAKEIGIRKTNGAHRHQLITQFLIESVVTSLLAFLLASIAFHFFLKPFFENFTIFQKLQIELREDLLLYVIFAALCILVGLVTGLFPSLYLSSISTSQALKDLQNKRWLPRLGWRRVLLVTQFSAALLFVVLLLNLYRQMSYVVKADYGFEKDNIINIDLQDNDFRTFKQAFAENHNVTGISGISHSLGTSRDRSIDVRIDPTDDKQGVRDYTIDEDYINNLKLQLVAGKNFTADLPNNRELFIIVNENFVQQFQLGNPIDAIGKRVLLEDSLSVSILGVVKDFHFRPFTYNIEPLLLRYNPGDIQQINIKLSGQNNNVAIAQLNETWKRLDKGRRFSFEFMANEIRESYREFIDLSSLLALVAFMAVAVACLGFLGLVIFMLKQRTKEISIRKILGASMAQLLLLLSRSFIKIFIITCLVGLPLAILVNQFIMQVFAYRVNPLTGYITGLILILFIAIVTIGSQIVRAAIVNPVNALRSE